MKGMHRNKKLAEGLDLLHCTAYGSNAVSCNDNKRNIRIGGHVVTELRFLASRFCF